MDERILLHMLFEIPEWYFPKESFNIQSPLILDLGAHHGYYTSLALAMYPGSRVISVEPASEGIEMIKSNVKLNKWESRVTIIHGALSDREGVGYLIKEGASWAFCVETGRRLAPPRQGQGQRNYERVPLLTLAQILSGQSPDIIKCNAEGAEFVLVDQLCELRIRPRLAIIMVHGAPTQLVGKMKGMGYRDQWICRGQSPVIHFWYDEGG